MKVFAREFVPLFASVAPAVALMTAPTADATSNQATCQQRGGARICQKQGHSSLQAEPRVRSAPAVTSQRHPIRRAR